MDRRSVHRNPRALRAAHGRPTVSTRSRRTLTVIAVLVSLVVTLDWTLRVLDEINEIERERESFYEL